MKISNSIRNIYKEQISSYTDLKNKVDDFLCQKKEPAWHYVSRLKTEESFALKLETGRVADPKRTDDLFACTLVVENHRMIAKAKDIVKSNFHVYCERPAQASKTYNYPSDFAFDDLRLYVSWEAVGVQPKPWHGLLFEVQIKTFLQHAWGIATHDLVYKTDSVVWAKNRIAFQVKAMLENAELSIAEAEILTESDILNKEDELTSQLKKTISHVKTRWNSDQLPRDLQRLAENIIELSRVLKIKLSDIWDIVDAATANGHGAKTLDLSPYGAICQALLESKGEGLFPPTVPGGKSKKYFSQLKAKSLAGFLQK